MISASRNTNITPGVRTIAKALVLMAFFLSVSAAFSVLPSTVHNSRQLASSTRCYSASMPEEDFQGDNYDSYRLNNPPQLDEQPPSTEDCYKDFRKRQAELNEGIGKRFVAHEPQEASVTAKVPVYDRPGGHIIGHLEEGQVIMTVGPRSGPWIRHDGGGWTLSVQGGFRFLQPVNE